MSNTTLQKMIFFLQKTFLYQHNSMLWHNIAHTLNLYLFEEVLLNSKWQIFQEKMYFCHIFE